MKITEVTDKNAQWASLADIDFSNIYSSYTTIKQAWPTILVKIKSDITKMIEYINHVLS